MSTRKKHVSPLYSVADFSKTLSKTTFQKKIRNEKKTRACARKTCTTLPPHSDHTSFLSKPMFALRSGHVGPRLHCQRSCLQHNTSAQHFRGAPHFLLLLVRAYVRVHSTLLFTLHFCFFVSVWFDFTYLHHAYTASVSDSTHGHSSGVGFSCDASLSGYSTDHGVHIFFFVFVFCFVMQLQRCYVCCVCFELYVGRQGSVVF